MPMAFSSDSLHQNLWIGLVLGCLVAVVLLVPGPQWSDRFEAVTYDWRFRVRPPVKPGDDVLLVGIDSLDLNLFGQWPWWRQDWGDLLIPLSDEAVRPAASVFDMLFIEEEDVRTDAHIAELAAMAASGNEDAARAAEFLRDLRDFHRESDEYFGAMIREAGNVDLAAYFNMSPGEAPTGADVSLIPESNRLRARAIHESIPEADSVEIPIGPLAEACNGIGFVNVLKDDDGVIRRTWTFLRHDGYLYPSLFLLAVCHYLGVEVSELDVQPGRYIIIPCSPRPIEIPIDGEGAMQINFRGRQAFLGPPQAVAYRDLVLALGKTSGKVAAGEGPGKTGFDARRLRGRILVFGMFAEGTPEDVGAVPGAENYPLVAYHANAIDNILRRDFIRPHPRFRRVLEAVLVVFFALATGTSVRYLSPVRGAASSIVFVVVYWALGFEAFTLFRWDLPLFRPTVAILLAFSGNVLYYFLAERRVRQRTVRFLSSYVSPDVVRRLLASGKELQFGGQRTHICILFSDIRGFTSLSERISPEEVVELLNEYFGAMTEIIFRNEGTLDKFMGDAIMAFYGHPEQRPDDAVRAVRTALEMQQRMRGLQEQWAVEEKESIGMGIGISTGEVVVGNVGTPGKAEYTAIGSAVNLAFRIQGIAQAGQVLISESTYREAAGEVEVRELEPVLVKGKEEPIAIYEVVRLRTEGDRRQPAPAAIPSGA